MDCSRICRAQTCAHSTDALVFFVCSVNDFSTTRGPIHAKVRTQAYSGSGVSSPLLGVGGARRAEKGANESFVTMGVNGEFLHFGVF